MANEFGATFLPGDNGDPMRRRPQAQGDALRVLAMTLPAVLGPGAIAPDLLMGAQGAAGLPGGQAASPLASLMAESIVNQVLGQGGGMGPLSGMQQQIAPQAPVMPQGVGAPTALSGQASLSNAVRTEAARPTGVAATGAAMPAPVVTGAPSPTMGAIPPPRVSGDPGTPPITQPTPQPIEQRPPITTIPEAGLIGGPDRPLDLGATIAALRNVLRPFQRPDLFA